MFTFLLVGLVGVWTVTLVGAGFLAVRFYLGEASRSRPVSTGTDALPFEAARAAGPVEVRQTRRVEPAAADGAAALRPRPFVLLPGPPRRGRRRRGSHRGRERSRQVLVR